MLRPVAGAVPQLTAVPAISARAASRTKGTDGAAQYRRLAGRRGRQPERPRKQSAKRRERLRQKVILEPAA